MPEILIHVKNKVPEIVGDIKYIVADNSDYSIRFTFDELWDNGEKTVYFIRSNGYVFPPAKTSNETVSVPVQKDVPILSWLHVGVQQGDIKTSCPCDVKLFPSAASYIKDDAVQPVPSMWEDIVSRMEELEKNGVPEDQITVAVEKYLKENHVTGGVPAGGTAGQILTKKSDADFDVEWTDLEIPKEYGHITYNQDKTIIVS